MYEEIDLDKENFVYVGDEVRDHEACKSIGVNFVAVSWGYDSEVRLKEASISRVVTSVESLRETLLSSNL